MSCKHLLPAFRVKSRSNPVSTADYFLKVDGTKFSNQGGKIMKQKPRICLEDRGKVLALPEEGYSQQVAVLSA